METLQALYQRRSIRKYTNKPVPKEIQDKLIKAAMYAPSARNYQSWQLIIIDNRKILDDISALHPYAKMMKQATLAVLVCADKNIEAEDGYNAINCSVATQNLLLAAFDLGLGSCWLGVYPRKERVKEISEYFKLPDHIMPINLVALGWPDERKDMPDRLDLSKVHYNKW
jgi:nitroreductase